MVGFKPLKQRSTRQIGNDGIIGIKLDPPPPSLVFAVAENVTAAISTGCWKKMAHIFWNIFKEMTFVVGVVLCTLTNFEVSLGTLLVVSLRANSWPKKRRDPGRLA